MCARVKAETVVTGDRRKVQEIKDTKELSIRHRPMPHVRDMTATSHSFILRPSTAVDKPSCLVNKQDLVVSRLCGFMA